MPRPKRSKIVAAAKPRPSRAHPHNAAPTESQPPASAVLDKVSSDSDGLVTRSAALRKGTTRLSSRQGSNELLMRGALGADDTPKAHHDKTHMAHVQLERRQELRRASVAAEEAADEKRTRNVAAQKQTRTKQSQPKTKPPRTSILHSTAQDALKPSTTTISASQFPGTAPPSTQKVPGTPSFLSMAKFKRRPRQNSLLTMVQQAAATRENSMIDGTGLDPGDDDEDSVLTLGGLSAQPTPSNAEARSSSSRKRKRGSDMAPSARSPSPPSSPPTQHPSIEPATRHPRQQQDTSAAATDPQPRSEDDQPSELNALPQMPHDPSPRPRSTKTRASKAAAPRRAQRQRIRPASPVPVQGTSPQSSPSPASPPAKQTATRPPQRAKRRQTQTQKPLSTAALQALLPTRRRRPAAFSILPDGASAGSDDDSPPSDPITESDSDADADADELSRRSRRKFGERSAAAALAASNARRTYGGSGAAAAARKGAARKGARKPVEDAEEGDGGGDEMVEAARKFAEVDEWEMSFESASLGGGGASSPWR